ncbi:Eco57I restriction-modification methylase domain-containing protein [Mariniflexile sp. HMF6888]|uniref:Eco57I restriction-modification methylase domain-containing protein n=1 Tax=Mariniflexile sp. HMF6888 TaxID=3373086 RepID=UPI00379DD847
MKNPLKNFLKQLDLSDAVFFKENGEVFNGFISEVQKKINIIQPDAYYVFNKQPLILFFDLTNQISPDRENEIHKQVWSFDNSPIVFVIKGDEIKVYNALNYDKDAESLEEILLEDKEINSKFSFWNLQSGFTWKWLQKEYFETQSKKQYRKRVNERLFENIKEVREYLTRHFTNPLSENQANSLILRLIFIRYLIDRKVKIDENLIAGDLENVNSRRKNFIQLIKNPSQLNLLFEKLNNKFNGVLFKELDVTLSQIQSDYLADVFKGELQDEANLFNGFFFEIFDFSIIPVEVISGIYESLIDEETRKLDAAVYTPPFLVEYVLNDTVDKYLEEENSSECKIFEVAVGSGIFLVQSLRKMIDKELEINPNQDNKKFSKRIREIVKNNLFGIDINGEALKVACFSIYIALLDYQDPKDIDVYEFPNLLNNNLFKADFFDIDHSFNSIIKKVNPKFILGNPPWKKDKSKKHLDWVNSTKTYSKRIVGKLEIAQSFLLRVKDFMNAETKSAIIITSTLFYNVSKTNKEFRADFLTSYCIKKFFDLSPVKQSLFEQQESPTSIVFFKLSHNKDYLNNSIKHQSIKVNKFLKHFKMLLMQKHDTKSILQKHFINNDWMFKVALYGNILDYKLLKNVKNNYGSIENLIENNKNIHKGAGIERGQNPNYYPDLIGLPIVENKSIAPYFTMVDESITLKEEDVYLSRGRDIEIFKGSKILLKEQAQDWSQPVVSFCPNDSVFRKGTFSISSSNEEILKSLYGILISDLATYYLFMTSSAWGIGTRPAIRFNDEFLSCPYIEPEKEKTEKLTSLVHKILIEFKNYYSSFPRPENSPINNIALTQINNIIYDIYGIKEYEKDLIDYTLNVSRYQFQESKQNLVSDFSKDETSYRNRDYMLKRYAEVYLNEFQKIYTNEYLQIEIYPLEHFIAINFIFSSQKPKESIIYPNKKNEAEVLKRLANNLSISQITNTTDPTKNIFIQKDIKGFEKNSFYIIKPNEYKCWHRAMAWYDVAEFKEAIETAELNNLSKSVNEF